MFWLYSFLALFFCTQIIAYVFALQLLDKLTQYPSLSRMKLLTLTPSSPDFHIAPLIPVTYIFPVIFLLILSLSISLSLCLQVFLVKIYSKLTIQIHHCFLQPSFPLKIFVLTSLSFGRSNSLNSSSDYIFFSLTLSLKQYFSWI